MQEYLGVYNQIFELHKHLRREWDTKPQPVVEADPDVRAKHETMVRLAQSMAGLVRELRFLPGGKGLHAPCRELALHLEIMIEMRDEEVVSLNDINRTLRAELMLKGLQIRTMDALLAYEKKNTRDAEERNARLIESLRNLVAQNTVIDNFRNLTIQDGTNEASTKVKKSRAKGRKLIQDSLMIQLLSRL